MNPAIRVYRYATGQSFGKHYDDSVVVNGLRSEWYALFTSFHSFIFDRHATTGLS